MGIGRIIFVIALASASTHGEMLAAVPAPLQADIDKVTAELKSTDTSQQDAAIKQIRVWVDGQRPVRNVWTEWAPDLMKAGRNQDAADLLLDECIQRPSESKSSDQDTSQSLAMVACMEKWTNWRPTRPT